MNFLFKPFRWFASCFVGVKQQVAYQTSSVVSWAQAAAATLVYPDWAKDLLVNINVFMDATKEVVVEFINSS